MTDDEKEFLEQICEITYSLMNSYTVLIHLEISGQKNNLAYKNELELLQLTIIEEDALYTYFKINPTSALLAATYLLEKSDFSSVNNAFTAMQKDKKQIMKTRILTKLKNIILRDYNIFIADIDPYLKEAIDEETISNGLDYLYEVLPLLESSTDFRLSDFTNRQIKDEKDTETKNELIKTKYYLAFLSDKLEEYYLKNEFKNILHSFSLETQVSISVLAETHDRVFDLHGMGLCLLALDELCKYDDEEVNANQNTIIILINLLKCGFLYLSQAGNELTDNEIKRTLSKLNNHEQVKRLITNAMNEKDAEKQYVNQDLSKENNYGGKND